jgi:hypothetical protein
MALGHGGFRDRPGLWEGSLTSSLEQGESMAESKHDLRIRWAKILALFAVFGAILNALTSAGERPISGLEIAFINAAAGALGGYICGPWLQYVFEFFRDKFWRHIWPPQF